MRSRPLTRPIAVILALVALALLSANFHLAHFATRARANTTTSTATGGGTPPPARILTLHIPGAGRLAGQVADALERRLTEVGAFDAVTAVTDLPETLSGPFLLIDIRRPGGIWTPFYTRRAAEVALFYEHTGGLDRADVALALEGTDTFLRGVHCAGTCYSGTRWTQVSEWGLGLISLPAYRSRWADQLAQQGADLVLDAAPPHLNPEKWADIAFDRVREHWQQKTASMSFHRVEGCRGGVVTAGAGDAPGRWGIFYYDADRDAIAESLTDADLMQAIRGEVGEPIRPVRFPVMGTGGDQAMVEVGTLADGRPVTLSVSIEDCALGDWSVSARPEPFPGPNN